MFLNKVVAVLTFTVAFTGMAQAATIPFTFDLTYDAFIVGVPSPTTPTLPTTVSGSGLYAPFGRATYSEAGTITFARLPSGEFVPSSVSNTFTASFNGGADTFTGIHSHVFDVSSGMTISNGMTILSGTGIFSGATGFATPTDDTIIASSGNPSPDYFATFSSSGTGQVTALGLTAVPEPATMALLSTCLAGLAGLAAIRKKRHHSTTGK